jgi:hypothetical protein
VKVEGRKGNRGEGVGEKGSEKGAQKRWGRGGGGATEADKGEGEENWKRKKGKKEVVASVDNGVGEDRDGWEGKEEERKSGGGRVGDKGWERGERGG